ncbi:MAG: hypothetical protein GX086_10640 [Alcaligenaceae bacterium]|nr:hypothetical protein [Alcaligenaceae bacterium]
MNSFAVVCRSLFFMVALWLCIIPRVGQAQDAKLSIELWAEAESFRSLASKNFLAALRSASTPDANLKFAELGELLWADDAGADDWSVFFRHSLINFVAGDYDVETVAFQHPWADIVLLTGWSRSPTDKRFRLVDLGMTMGSVARGAKAPFPTGLAWMNEKRYAPEAVGVLNAATTKAIARFEAGETNNPFADIGQEGAMAMILGAALQWGEHQVNVLPLFGNNAKSRATRFAWNELIVAGQRGTLGNILPPDIPAAAFKAIDTALWATLEPVVYIENGNTAVSLFTSWRNPDMYAVLTLRGDDTRMEIIDFGFYSFSGFITRDAQ